MDKTPNIKKIAQPIYIQVHRGPGCCQSVVLILLFGLSAYFCAGLVSLEIGSEEAMLWGSCIGVVFFPWLAYWLLCRAFHILPITGDFPECPHCRRSPKVYRVSAIEWPLIQMVCPDCHQELDLWILKPGNRTGTDGNVRFYLGWPKVFGNWRRLPE